MQQEICLYLPHFIIVFFLPLNSMNISNCCVSSKFPVLNLRWGIFPQLSNLLQTLDICDFNTIIFVFLSWAYLHVLEVPSFFCNLFSISIFKYDNICMSIMNVVAFFEVGHLPSTFRPFTNFTHFTHTLIKNDNFSQVFINWYNTVI